MLEQKTSPFRRPSRRYKTNVRTLVVKKPTLRSIRCLNLPIDQTTTN